MKTSKIDFNDPNWYQKHSNSEETWIKKITRKMTLFLAGFSFFVIAALSLYSCTENTRARSWGGKMTIDLPANQKLINATWKETDLWILTKPMTSTDVPETYKFIEKSTFGMMEGEITFKETK